MTTSWVELHGVKRNFASYSIIQTLEWLRSTGLILGWQLPCEYDPSSFSWRLRCQVIISRRFPLPCRTALDQLRPSDEFEIEYTIPAPLGDLGLDVVAPRIDAAVRAEWSRRSALEQAENGG